MIHSRIHPIALSTAAAVLSLAATAAYSQSPDAPAETPPWQVPDVEQVKTRAFAWLEANQADEATRAKATELWSNVADPSGETELLACLSGTFALVDPNAARLVELCSRPKDQWLLPSQPWLVDPQTPPLVAHNMRLLYGRWLAHEALYDESLEQLGDLDPSDVVAPATLLFYQAVVHHRLLDQEAGLAVTEQLLQGARQIPRRYIAVARLMQQDLQGLEDDTLDHIARRMDDVRRRLDLGRAGKRVRGVEDGVIESLDKLIKKLEEQQQQSQSGGAGGNNIRSTQPASDSRIISGKGPGEVVKRGIGSGSGWGELPPKQREEALQQIGRDFPSHYRDVIEQYFRRLAGEEND